MELLAAIGIIAGLLVVAGVYIGGYIGTARQRADAQTLTVLNDAITRYKTQGGGTSGFTLGAPISNILSRLQQPLNWNGLNHQVMKTGTTYRARSLSVTGTGASYRFTRFNSSTSEVGGVTNPNLNSSNGGLVAWWKFDEGSGTTVTDSSGGGITGTLTATSAGPPIYTSGRQATGYALNFDGTNYVIGNSIQFRFPNTAFTVSAWVRSSNTPYAYFLASDGFGGGWGLLIDGGGRAGVMLKSAGAYSVTVFAGGSNIIDGNWHQVTYVIGTNTTNSSLCTCTIYVDGIQVATGAGSGIYSYSDPTVNWTIGTRNLATAISFTGQLDDVRIYNRALTAAEISALYAE